MQLFMQLEAAHDTVDELGELGIIQFKDVRFLDSNSLRIHCTNFYLRYEQLNPDVNLFQRNFVTEVKRADEMERKIRFFEAEIAKENFEEELEMYSLRFGSSHRTIAPEMDELEVLC